MGRSYRNEQALVRPELLLKLNPYSPPAITMRGPIRGFSGEAPQTLLNLME